MGKEPRSFSIDESINRELTERDDLNPSPAVNKFLHEYLRAGRGAEAAYEAQLQEVEREITDIDKEIAELEAKKRDKERQRERIEGLLDERRATLEDVLDRAEEKVELGWEPDPDSEVVLNWAREAGVTTDRFISELEGRLS